MKYLRDYNIKSCFWQIETFVMEIIPTNNSPNIYAWRVINIRGEIMTLFLIHPYPIYRHSLGKSRGIIWRTRPVTSDRHIEDDIEGFMKNIESIGFFRNIRYLIDMPIHNMFYGFLIPLDSVDMKIIAPAPIIRI